MDDSPRRSSPIPTFVMLFALVGGAVYFFQNYEISGLDGISVHNKVGTSNPDSSANGFGAFDAVDFSDSTSLVGLQNADESSDGQTESSDSFLAGWIGTARPSSPTTRPPHRQNLRIGSWALGGLGPSKWNNDAARQNLVRIASGFDILALQQISSSARDLVPQLVNAMNENGRQYDFIVETTAGNLRQPDQLAVVFDASRVSVDRSQTYTVADPGNATTVDPLVTWFRVKEIPASRAWTFSLVNVHVDLTRAKSEVALLPNLFSAVRMDGRGEDDVVMAGLIQADDRYLMPHVMGHDVDVAVKGGSTDIFGDHQTSNVMIHRQRTSEYLGRGGVVNFPQIYQLSMSEAEAISPNLPVFAEFTLSEGGSL